MSMSRKMLGWMLVGAGAVMAVVYFVLLFSLMDVELVPLVVVGLVVMFAGIGLQGRRALGVALVLLGALCMYMAFGLTTRAPAWQEGYPPFREWYSISMLVVGAAMAVGGVCIIWGAIHARRSSRGSTA